MFLCTFFDSKASLTLFLFPLGIELFLSSLVSAWYIAFFSIREKKKEKRNFRNANVSLPSTCRYYVITRKLYIVPSFLAFAHVLKVVYSILGNILTELYVCGRKKNISKDSEILDFIVNISLLLLEAKLVSQ